jgi:hypothetical protein
LEFTIFYAWQSQLPNSTNRGFIEKELAAVTKEFQTDDVLIVIDRDTAGVPGAPDIGQTILEKIGVSDLFVGDVSIVNPDAAQERKTPNANVLVEVGYALGTIGPRRVLLVMNLAHGKPEDLPFDLRQKRTEKYELKEADNKDKARQTLRAQLRGRIAQAIQAHGKATPAAPVPDRASPALDAIRNRRASQDIEAKQLVQVLAEGLDKLDPHALPGDQTENLLQAIEATRPIVNDFGRVAKLAAAEKSQETVHGLVQGMEHFLNRFHPRTGGSHRDSDFDLFRVVAHELVTVLAGHLMRAERWTLVASLFLEKIHRDVPGEAFQPVGIQRLSSPSRLLTVRSKGTGRASVQADLLKVRHESAPPVGELAFADFLAADLLLFLGTFDPNQGYVRWHPNSAAYLGDRAPRFLSATSTVAGSKNLAVALGQRNLETMKAHVTGALSILGRALESQHVFLEPWFFDPAQIVTEE